MLDGKPLPDAQQQALADAGLLVLNKSNTLTQADRERLTAQLPGRALYWTQHAALPIERLPGLMALGHGAVDNLTLPKRLGRYRPSGPTQLSQSACISNRRVAGVSVGAGTQANDSMQRR